MTIIKPKKLHQGDEIRVIAPSRSLALISENVKKIAISLIDNLIFNFHI
jgi:muramoyltetrapeptide carboxypeptidase LdcA involved in peptidoglycan recycling